MRLTNGYDRHRGAVNVLTEHHLIINRDGTWQRGYPALPAPDPAHWTVRFVKWLVDSLEGRN